MKQRNVYLCQNTNDMKDDKMKNPPFLGFAIVAVLVLLAVVFITVSLTKGIAAFFEDGGGTWLLVIAGLCIVVGLIYRATPKKE